MTPYRSAAHPIVVDIAHQPRWSGAVRTAGRVLFMAIILSTAMASGALFVAWPTQTESQSSMHMSVGTRMGAVTENDQLCKSDDGLQGACYVVEASP